MPHFGFTNMIYAEGILNAVKMSTLTSKYEFDIGLGLAFIL